MPYLENNVLKTIDVKITTEGFKVGAHTYQVKKASLQIKLKSITILGNETTPKITMEGSAIGVTQAMQNPMTLDEITKIIMDMSKGNTPIKMKELTLVKGN